MNKVSVIICTHNPKREYIDKVLDSLKEQTLSQKSWELLLVDNASERLLANEIDISWHLNFQHIREERVGLTHARLCGIKASSNEILVFVDDDNVLAKNYLENAYKIMYENQYLGAIGGKVLPNFEINPECWIENFWICLALRDLGEEAKTYFWNENLDRLQYPIFSPIGAGMVLRQKAAKIYTESIANDPRRISLDRTGNSLQSGGDCDINLTLLHSGLGIGYFPQLQLTHIISSSRLSKNYLARLNYASCRSWVQVLDFHSIRPWKKIPVWSVMPRKIKSFFHCQTWKSPAAFVNWRGTCGIFDALAELET